MNEFTSFKDNPPKLGDMGYIPWRDFFIPIAIVNHMIKDNTLCIMRKYAGISNDLAWQEIGCDFDPTEWKKCCNSLNINDCMKWVLLGNIE